MDFYTPKARASHLKSIFIARSWTAFHYGQCLTQHPTEYSALKQSFFLRCRETESICNTYVQFLQFSYNLGIINSVSKILRDVLLTLLALLSIAPEIFGNCTHKKYCYHYGEREEAQINGCHTFTFF